MWNWNESMALRLGILVGLCVLVCLGLLSWRLLQDPPRYAALEHESVNLMEKGEYLKAIETVREMTFLDKKRLKGRFHILNAMDRWNIVGANLLAEARFNEAWKIYLGLRDLSDLVQSTKFQEISRERMEEIQERLCEVNGTEESTSICNTNVLQNYSATNCGSRCW